MAVGHPVTGTIPTDTVATVPVGIVSVFVRFTHEFVFSGKDFPAKNGL